jgi:hypothetical protein
MRNAVTMRVAAIWKRLFTWLITTTVAPMTHNITQLPHLTLLLLIAVEKTKSSVSREINVSMLKSTAVKRMKFGATTHANLMMATLAAHPLKPTANGKIGNVLNTVANMVNAIQPDVRQAKMIHAVMQMKKFAHGMNSHVFLRMMIVAQNLSFTAMF